LAVKPTNKPEAYDAYFRGLAFEARGWYPIDSLWKAISFYERAVQLDPSFALAWTRLSRTDAVLYFTGGDTTAARRDAAKKALENAQKLHPNSPETLLALGYYQYWVLRDYGLARTTFKRAAGVLFLVLGVGMATTNGCCETSFPSSRLINGCRASLRVNWPNERRRADSSAS
jgi:tetratricopeptide (TPR) repeat protein